MIGCKAARLQGYEGCKAAKAAKGRKGCKALKAAGLRVGAGNRWGGGARFWYSSARTRSEQWGVSDYHDLKAWRLSHRLALDVYQLTEGFPQRERYGLAAQARRAAFSVANSLVEGTARQGDREWRRFINMSLGSLAELQYILEFSRDVGLIEQESYVTLEATRAEAARATWGLYVSVLRRSGKGKVQH